MEFSDLLGLIFSGIGAFVALAIYIDSKTKT